jgi:hypothetical protein
MEKKNGSKREARRREDCTGEWGVDEKIVQQE